MDELIVAVEEAEFRKAMSCFASGVTVVTTEHEGAQLGITVSAFSSLSLEPPLVLVCIEKSTHIHDVIGKAERFAVNVLHEGQQEISNQFASRADDRFEGIPVEAGRLKLPLLSDALAAVECRLHASLPGGDHTIFVGEVIGTHMRNGNPLLYYRSAYRKLADGE